MMEREEARILLYRIRTNRIRTQRIRKELAILEEDMSSIGAVDTTAIRVSSSPRPSFFKETRILERMESLRTELAQTYAEVEDIIDHIVATIRTIPDGLLAAVLEFRYLDVLDWHEIADKIGYSWFHTIHRLHPRALEEFRKRF